MLIGVGVGLHFAGMPMNKQLWSASYTFFMAGTCGASLMLVYILVDTGKGYNKFFRRLLGIKVRKILPPNIF